ncbi:MAG: molybdate transport system ATP-binding protein [Acidimicrobiaceae bacterium]|nr:molybdate transport system ATP-binding protein [Acidimicrobiaceae bacterium]
MSLDADARVEVGEFALQAQLSAAAGQTVAVLGPNGAGKTTLLRVLAGLLPLTDGRVVLDGAVLDDPSAGVFVSAEHRPIGVVFQDYLLFPHLTALENVAFGLRARGVHRAAARSRAADWLDRVGLSAAAASRPAQLSGGQAQRVALARALVSDPALLLMDEPLAALDVGTRGEVRRDLRRHLSSFGGVRVLVTHDPLEAATLADHLVVLENGKVVQTGDLDELTAHPRSDYVAELAGTNLLRGRAVGNEIAVAGGGTLTIASPASGDVLAVVPPRAVALSRARHEGSPRNVWPGRVDGIERVGDRARVRVVGPLALVAEITAASVHDLGLGENSEVWMSVKATEILVYPA